MGLLAQNWKNIYKFSSLNLLMLSETFLEMSYYHKNFGRTKLKFCPLWKNWCLISIPWPIAPKLKNPHKFTSLNFFMLSETILEMSYCQLNRLEILPFSGVPEAQNKKRPLRHGLLGVLNTLLTFSYPREADYDKKPYVS